MSDRLILEQKAKAGLGGNSGILAAYRARTPASADLAAEAHTLLPSGIAHDSRHVDPYGIYIARAQGPHKWDVDGNRYIDFFGGHGALILGHSHPTVTKAVAGALQDGTQFGASHAGEIGWARAIRRLVPSAERIRFHSSGTEATLMALRLARAFTGREKILRFQGHFHGWHDQMTSGYTNHYDGSATPGVIDGVAQAQILVPPGDIPALRAAFAAHPDIAAVILEPTGSSFGQVPLDAAFSQEVRALCDLHGTLLIFDEVVTGFRASAGGAQQAFGVTPDLSSWAKIVAGGMPGACITGRKDILDLLDFEASAAKKQEKIGHPGTFNANPVSAAAGTAALTILAETDAADQASAMATNLRASLNEMYASEGVNWAAYGTFSGFHTYMSEGGSIDPVTFDPTTRGMMQLKSQPQRLGSRLRLALLVQGIDTNGRIGGFLSTTHTQADVEQTVAGFRAAIQMLRADGEM
jgi:glutamate-1-semialdehyde 2,1-aminomutase